MEDTIDLRPLFALVLIPLRRWYVVLSCTLVAILVTIVPARLAQARTPLVPIYEATAGVAIVRSRTQITFDSAVKTLSDEELNAPAVNQAAQVQMAESERQARRLTLVALVQNGDIAQRVCQELSSELDLEEHSPSALAAMVTGRVATVAQVGTDLIQIVVQNSDPVKAASIANAWAEAYEEVVNDLYGGPPGRASQLLKDAEQAKQEYNETQEALISFRAESRTSEAQRQIDDRLAILETLSAARDQAISQAIDAEIQANTELYMAYLSAQSANQLLAFNVEQTRKRQLLQAYMDGQTNAQVGVITNQIAERQRILDDAYAALATVDSQLRHAKVLRDKAAKGGESGTTSLALAFLTAEVSGATVPGGLELRLDSLSDLLSTDLAKDTEGLVAALENQKAELESTIKRQTLLLRSDQGLTLEDPPTDTELTQLIREKYPELFEPGELSKLSEEIMEDNPMKRTALALAQELLQMKDRESLLSFSTADSPLNDALSDLEQEVRSLQAGIERDKGKEEDLVQTRDLAYESYISLARKAVEVRLSEQVPGTEVRFAASAPVPDRPLVPESDVITIAKYAALGFGLGIVAVYVIEEWQRSRRGDSILSLFPQVTGSSRPPEA